MQRYVKLVMGLLILLSILTPIMQLLQKDFSPEKIALKIINTSDTSQSMNQIKSYGEKLMKSNEQDMTQFVRGQMESLIKAKVEEQFGVAVASVKVSINHKNMDKEQEYPVISAVQLVLDKDSKPSKQKGEVKEAKPNIEIKPVEPVTIHVAKTPEAAPAVSASSDLPADQQKMITDITQFVAQAWSIDQTQVEAMFERKNGEGKG